MVEQMASPRPSPFGHGVHRIHEEIEEHLLQRDRIAAGLWQTIRESGFHVNVAADQFVFEKRDRRMGQIIEVDRLGFFLAFSQQMP